MTKADTAYLPPDDQARATIAALYYGARTAALAFVHPDTTAPFVSRIAFLALSPVRAVTLISSLSLHYTALQKDPRAAVLLGETANRGDPLNSPRLSLTVRASFLSAKSEDHRALRDRWLSAHPKAKLYVDFADFAFVSLTVTDGLLNGGFGRAFQLTPSDMPGALELPVPDQGPEPAKPHP